MVDRDLWRPDPEVTAHDGSPLPVDLDFFVAPPPEIGPVVTAWSTLRRGEGVHSRWIRLLTTGVGVAVFVAAIEILFTEKRLAESGGLILLGLAAGLMVVVVGMMRIKAVTCTYVGVEGLAQFGARRRLRSPNSGTVLRFADAVTLWAMVDLQSTDAAEFRYTWTRATSAGPFRIAGWRRLKPPYGPGDGIVFATRAEHAWAAYLFPLVTGRLVAGESLEFGRLRGGSVTLTKDQIRLLDRADDETVRIVDSLGISVERDAIVLIHRDAAGGGMPIRPVATGSISLMEINDGYLLYALMRNLVSDESGRTPETLRPAP